MAQWHGVQIGTWAQLASAMFALLAVVIAGIAWRLNLLAFRTSFRPVVRPVPMFSNGKLVRTALLLKNYGRGSAFSAMLFEDSAVFYSADPIAMVSVVEPLGGGATEAKRLGRVQLNLSAGASLVDGHRYRLLYQDLEGLIHETELTINQTSEFVVKFLGTRLVEHVPKRVRELAMVVLPEVP